MYNLDLSKKRQIRRINRNAMNFIFVVLIGAGFLLNIVLTFSAANASGVSLFDYMQISDFGIFLMVFEYDPVKWGISMAMFAVGIIGVFFNNVRLR